jgi:hypothetical protein
MLSVNFFVLLRRQDKKNDMPKICYIEKRFGPDNKKLIDSANEIIKDYRAQGFSLTLRQLYYQFVSRALIENTEASYKRVGNIINDARLAGMIDWEAIEDRTRNLEDLTHWDSPAQLIESSLYNFRLDRWKTQPLRVEVWVEKEALSDVIKRACEPFDVPYICCRGYMSQSEMWVASERIGDAFRDREQPTVILHLGDHDPSGMDMSRDIEERLILFLGNDFDLEEESPLQFERIALNIDQVQRYKPPPNPAKVEDSRFESYVEKFGKKSWELDALNPSVLTELLRIEIQSRISDVLWRQTVKQEKQGLAKLEKIIQSLK